MTKNEKEHFPLLIEQADRDTRKIWDIVNDAMAFAQIGIYFVTS